MPSPLSPSTALLVKLGSLIVHADEALSANAHPFDAQAFRALAGDDEVREWLDSMGALALLPVKRDV